MPSVIRAEESRAGLKEKDRQEDKMEKEASGSGM